ncbi:hypothetical protein C8R44DRAFT_725019 [Mycena epipterygia]|nr:hypothetical protein C8R44DRAFT_725019 [Mycena epipterygia]
MSPSKKKFKQISGISARAGLEINNPHGYPGIIHVSATKGCTAVSSSILLRCGNSEKPDYSIIDVATLSAFDAIIMCISAVTATFPAYFASPIPFSPSPTLVRSQAFWDRTSTLCGTGALAASHNATSTLIHHGSASRYADVFDQLTEVNDGPIFPPSLRAHETFYGVVSKISFRVPQCAVGTATSIASSHHELWIALPHRAYCSFCTPDKFGWHICSLTGTNSLEAEILTGRATCVGSN